jgi:hypothetical protein
MARRSVRLSRAQPAEELFSGVLIAGIGSLFFVAVYIAIAAHNLRPVITTPLVTPADTRPVLFECRANTVFRPGYDELIDRTVAVFNRCLGSSPARAAGCARELAARPEKNDYYRTKAIPVNCPPDGKPQLAVQLELAPDMKGESMYELREPDSVFRRELARLDPSREHLIFFVRGDSFAVFHSARLVARQMGFRAGWEPLDIKAELGTGCPGGPAGGFRLDPQ